MGKRYFFHTLHELFYILRNVANFLKDLIRLLLKCGMRYNTVRHCFLWNMKSKMAATAEPYLV